MRVFYLFVVLAMVCECSASTIDEYALRAAKTKIWTSADGRYTTEAILLRSTPTKVTLEKLDGEVIRVKQEQLCEEDRQFITHREWEFDPSWSKTDWEKWEAAVQKRSGERETRLVKVRLVAEQKAKDRRNRIKEKLDAQLDSQLAPPIDGSMYAGGGGSLSGGSGGGSVWERGHYRNNPNGGRSWENGHSRKK